jgi:4-diphosphocytidyl-2-C-methyl-D-erythritol kinase
MISERAHAKVNLVLQVGRPRPDGLHPICSLFASLELADELCVVEADEDAVECPGVNGHNLVSRALELFRRAHPDGLRPLAIRIDKRIPVAAGLGGGSADAAAALRLANRLAGDPLHLDSMRAIAARVGSDVPSQVEPRHALVSGVGEQVEPVELPPLALVLVPHRIGLATADVYRQLDRLGGWRERLEPAAVRELAGAPVERLAAAVENDLEAAALSLRPELARTLAALRERGALAAAVSGSGPTAFGLFRDAQEAERAAGSLPGALVTRTREPR